MSETEKITINMNVVDLGKIDLLVEKGFYSNRTDFIKNAIRDSITVHEKDIAKTTDLNVYTLGINYITRVQFEKAKASGSKIRIFVIGMLVIPEDVPADLVWETVESYHLYGVLRASDKVKVILEQLSQPY